MGPVAQPLPDHGAFDVARDHTGLVGTDVVLHAGSEGLDPAKDVESGRVEGVGCAEFGPQMFLDDQCQLGKLGARFEVAKHVHHNVAEGRHSATGGIRQSVLEHPFDPFASKQYVHVDFVDLVGAAVPDPVPDLSLAEGGVFCLGFTTTVVVGGLVEVRLC